MRPETESQHTHLEGIQRDDEDLEDGSVAICTTLRPGMAYRIKLLPADFAIISKFSEDIDHYVGRHGNHRGSCGEDLIPKHNGRIEISLLLQMMFVHS